VGFSLLFCVSVRGDDARTHAGADAPSSRPTCSRELGAMCQVEDGDGDGDASFLSPPYSIFLNNRALCYILNTDPLFSLTAPSPPTTSSSSPPTPRVRRTRTRSTPLLCRRAGTLGARGLGSSFWISSRLTRRIRGRRLRIGRRRLVGFLSMFLVFFWGESFVSLVSLNPWSCCD
jgi:hypothetical protein